MCPWRGASRAETQPPQPFWPWLKEEEAKGPAWDPLPRHTRRPSPQTWTGRMPSSHMGQPLAQGAAPSQEQNRSPGRGLPGRVLERTEMRGKVGVRRGPLQGQAMGQDPRHQPCVSTRSERPHLTPVTAYRASRSSSVNPVPQRPRPPGPRCPLHKGLFAQQGITCFFKWTVWATVFEE